MVLEVLVFLAIRDFLFLLGWLLNHEDGILHPPPKECQWVEAREKPQLVPHFPKHLPLRRAYSDGRRGCHSLPLCKEGAQKWDGLRWAVTEDCGRSHRLLRYVPLRQTFFAQSFLDLCRPQ